MRSLKTKPFHFYTAAIILIISFLTPSLNYPFANESVSLCSFKISSVSMNSTLDIIIADMAY